MGLTSLRRGTEPLHVILTMLCAYSNRVQLQKYLLYDVNYYHWTWDKFQVYCPIICCGQASYVLILFE